MICELTAEEYRDTIRSLNNKYFKSFTNDIGSGICFKDSGDIVLERVYAVEEVSKERYFQYKHIPVEYTKTPNPVVKIKINSWEEMQQLFNDISKIQKEYYSSEI